MCARKIVTLPCNNNLGTLSVGDTSVAIVNKARNLGVMFDSQLNFNVHISKKCSLSFCSLYKIRLIRKYLSYKSAQTLILALVIGRLDYCNSLLYGLPASYIIKLQQVQNVHLQYHAFWSHFSCYERLALATS